MWIVIREHVTLRNDATVAAAESEPMVDDTSDHANSHLLPLTRNSALHCTDIFHSTLDHCRGHLISFPPPSALLSVLSFPQRPVRTNESGSRKHGVRACERKPDSRGDE